MVNVDAHLSWVQTGSHVTLTGHIDVQIVKTLIIDSGKPKTENMLENLIEMNIIGIMAVLL